MISKLTNAHARALRSPIAKRFLGGAAWSVLGAVISSGLTLITLMLVARMLSKEVYGQFVVIQSTLSMVGVLAGVGIGIAATRFAAELKQHDTIRLGHILILAERSLLAFGLLASLGLAISANWMAMHILYSPSLALPLAISAAAILFSAIDAYQKSVLIGFESMRAFAIGTMVSGVLGVPVMLAAASVYGLTGSAVALVINAFISAAISRYQMANELKKFCIPVNSNGCLREWRILWGFALPALLSSALIAPAHWAVQAMLARTSNGYAELAVLGIAMQWFNVIMFLPGTAGRIVLPILSSRLENNIQNRLPQKIAFYAAGLNAFLSIPILIAVIIGAQHIMGLYGQAYVKDYPVLVLAAFAAIANAIHGPLNSLIVSESRVWLSAFFVAIWAFVYVGIAYTAIKLGAFGVMLGLTIGHVVFAICAIVTIFFYQRRNANIG